VVPLRRWRHPAHAGDGRGLRARYDCTCVRYRTECGEQAWAADSAFHTGLWLARTEALRQIPPPWFDWATDESRTRIMADVCSGFRRKVLEAGLTKATRAMRCTTQGDEGAGGGAGAGVHPE